MGTQSIINRNQEYYSELFEKKLFRYSDDYYIKKHFLVGEGTNRDKVMFAMQMSPIFCTANCTLVDYIKKEIVGELKDKSCSRKDKLEDLLKKYNKDCSCGKKECICFTYWKESEW